MGGKAPQKKSCLTTSPLEPFFQLVAPASGGCGEEDQFAFDRLVDSGQHVFHRIALRLAAVEP